MTKKKIRNLKPGKGHNKIRPRHDVFDPFEPISTNDTHPAFCFRYIQPGYTVRQCDAKSQAICAKRLEILGELSWGEILNSPRHGVGREIIEQDSIKKPLPSNTPGDRNFLAFRLGGSKQSVMIGYRKDKVFYVVWIDPDGQVYNHG